MRSALLTERSNAPVYNALKRTTYRLETELQLDKDIHDLCNMGALHPTA